LRNAAGCALFAALASVAAAQEAAAPTVHVTASSTEVSIGETFYVDIQTSGPPGTTWTFPEESGSETIQMAPATLDPEAPSLPPGTRRYSAAVFTLEDAEVPALNVSYRLPDGTEGEQVTEPIPLRIVSLLPKDPEEQKLVDIHGPRALAIAPAFWIGVGLVIVLLAGLAYWIWRGFRPRSDPAMPRIERAPDVEALAELRVLADSGLIDGGAFREFYIRLSQIAKRYLERRLDAPVLEMTSAEAGAFLRQHRHGEALFPAMRNLASAADAVKFAHGAGQAEEAERHLTATREIIRGLEARLQPEVPAPTGSDGVGSVGSR